MLPHEFYPERTHVDFDRTVSIDVIQWRFIDDNLYRFIFGPIIYITATDPIYCIHFDLLNLSKSMAIIDIVFVSGDDSTKFSRMTGRIDSTPTNGTDFTMTPRWHCADLNCLFHVHDNVTESVVSHDRKF